VDGEDETERVRAVLGCASGFLCVCVLLGSLACASLFCVCIWVPLHVLRVPLRVLRVPLRVLLGSLECASLFCVCIWVTLRVLLGSFACASGFLCMCIWVPLRVHLGSFACASWFLCVCFVVPWCVLLVVMVMLLLDYFALVWRQQGLMLYTELGEGYSQLVRAVDIY